MGLINLVSATLQPTGDKIRLSFGIPNLRTGDVVAAEMYDFTEGEIFQYQDKIAELVL